MEELRLTIHEWERRPHFSLAVVAANGDLQLQGLRAAQLPHQNVPMLAQEKENPQNILHKVPETNSTELSKCMEVTPTHDDGGGIQIRADASC